MYDAFRLSALQALYATYLDAPDQVSPAWAEVFDQLDPQARAFLMPATQEDGWMHSRMYGHTAADLDPLGLVRPDIHPSLESVEAPDDPAVIEARRIYCGRIGFEYMYIAAPAEQAWIHQQALAFAQNTSDATAAQDRWTLLRRATAFEDFLHLKYPAAKRFGLEGGESVVIALDEIVKVAAQNAVTDIALGMAHRGRLNVLSHILEKPYAATLAAFQDGHAVPQEPGFSGDVKYHLGYTNEIIREGRTLRISLAPNPSHLEAVNPVVLGQIRATQDLNQDSARTRSMSLLIHGDAAVAGQGIVAETLLLSQLPGYRTGGTIHVVIDNQVGFTTGPDQARSSRYCTDIAKMVEAPVFHVNGDDIEAVTYAARAAALFRHTFAKDVFLRVVCYRYNGHNEMDEPGFTQPQMYAHIRARSRVGERYSQELQARGILSPQDIAVREAQIRSTLDIAFQAASAAQPPSVDRSSSPISTTDTGISDQIWTDVAKALTTLPPGFALHKRLERLQQQRRQAVESGAGIDWATAESLAFGATLAQGHPVRLSGQDVARGTFSQRHAAFVDQDTEAVYVPLNHVPGAPATLELMNSPLSEAAVLGYEYGYSCKAPQTLVLWEAQFGDFANNAQVIIDQFIAAGEAKWRSRCTLVMMLPHGYEGQGPEHSSARLERYLQMSAQENWRVVYCTTPANHFHALRRQICDQSRKPLIAITPKSLLRHPEVISARQDFGVETHFQTVIEDAHVGKSAQRVVLCCGKVYYDLLQKRRAEKRDDVALVRIEQLYPFPRDALLEVLAPYGQAQFVWCQEEPANMGAWSFIDRPLEAVQRDLGNTRPLILAARPAAASPATGYAHVHDQTQNALVALALGLEISQKSSPEKVQETRGKRNG